jgi:hypothetical protein
MGSVPEPYLDAWARLQVQKPMRVSDADWRLAINDAARFLDQWGKLADSFGWTPGDLFDVPHDGATRGVVWFIKGELSESKQEERPQPARDEAPEDFDL